MERNSVVGIDVSKARLDVAFRPSGKRLVISNDARGISRLANVLKEAKPECVLLEATGGYELKLLERLLADSVAVAVANPHQVREFARASGRLAKTDAIDADVLAHYAAVMEPELRKMPDAQTRKLRALLTRRRQLLVMMVAESNRSTHALDVVRRGIAVTLRCFKKQIAALDRELATFIRETPALACEIRIAAERSGCGRGCLCDPARASAGARYTQPQEDRCSGGCGAIQSGQRNATRPANDLGWPRSGPLGLVHVHTGRDRPQSDHCRLLSTSAGCREAIESRSDRMRSQAHRKPQRSQRGTRWGGEPRHRLISETVALTQNRRAVLPPRL